MKSIYNCTGHELKIHDVVDSQGIYLIDQNGKQYMDLESGVWCAALGHKNNRINNVIKNQIDSIMHTGFCYSTEVVERAAKSVLSITNFKNGQCVFLCSGSEAIEILRQISRQIKGKNKTLVLHDAYLGSYSSTIDRIDGWHIFNWEECKTCPVNDKCSSNCPALQNIPKDITEYIFEPGSGSGFVRFPPKALIQNIVNIVRNNNGVIVANEVTTGVGRTGTWFGYQHYGIEPDMIAIGKGIGNGYPVSVAAINQATIKELENKHFKYMQSHQNDPLGAAVTHEVIQIIKEDKLLENSARKGNIFLAQLNELIDNEIIMGVRGRGLMFAVELADEKIGNEFYNELIRAGYIVCNRGSLFRIDPPLTITEEEFSSFINTFKSLIAAKKTTLSK